MPGEFVPISLFAALAVVLGLFLYFRTRVKADAQTTIRAAIERGQELTPEVLELLSDAGTGGQRDLRRALVSIAIGGGFLAFAFLVGEEDAIGPIAGISAFPFLIGIAYLALWRFSGKKA